VRLVKTRSVTLRANAAVGTGGLREMLRAELGRRCAGNAGYSLRAFARFLRTDHATLSQILRGKRRLSEATIRRLAVRLGCDAPRVEALVLEERSAAATPEAIDVASLREMTERTLESLGNWHDWAILELTRLDCFVPDARWIARVLDCSTDEVQLALHRLTSLGFLQMTVRDRWTDTGGHVLQNAEAFAAAAVERLAEELHELAARALRRASPARWTHSATTIAVDAATVPLAIRRIEQFRAELGAMLEAAGRRDAVYYLTLSFLPIASPQPKGDPPWDVPS
jgi:uncharacterized protein (TIGR02147 family)